MSMEKATKTAANASTDPSVLALDGGEKALPKTPVRRLFGAEEKEAVMQLFDKAIATGSGVMGYNGEQEEAYCAAFTDFMGGGFADGVNSGSNAVFVALRALELEPYSEVITSPVSDPGGVMPVALCNLIPVPADADTEFYNTSAAQIEARITDRTRAILVSHIAGLPIDMEPVMELAKARGLHVIEDCAQAHGALIRCRDGSTRMAGTFGHVAAFSTMFGKHHATGGQGGVVYSTDEGMYWRIRRHADRGKPFGLSLQGGAGAGVGGASAGGANAVAALNCNMDELHACIGRVQLQKLPQMLAIRRRNASRIATACEGLAGVRLVTDPAWGENIYWHLFYTFDAAAYRVSKEDYVKALAAEGLLAGPSYGHYPSRMIWAREQNVFGTSRLPWSAVPGTRPAEDYPLPNAEAVDERHFMMMVNEAWDESAVEAIIAALNKVDRAYRL